MAVTIPDAPELVTPGNLGDELASFVRAMRATNVSPNTILAYGGAVRQFGRWLMAVRVLGKGGKDNVIAVSDKTLSAPDDYLRVRRKHDDAALPWLWLGKRGQLTDSGIAQTLRERGRRVGIPNLHAHDFRHAATHLELAGGMTESDVMSKRGWDSAVMLRRYASTMANERAIAASRKLALGDKL